MNNGKNGYPLKTGQLVKSDGSCFCNAKPELCLQVRSQTGVWEREVSRFRWIAKFGYQFKPGHLVFNHEIHKKHEIHEKYLQIKADCVPNIREQADSDF